MKQLLLKTSSLLILIWGLSFSVSQAGSGSFGARFGNPTIAGDGCLFSRTGYVISIDRETITLSPQGYAATAGSVSCNMAVPVRVPNGYQLVLLGADLSGSVSGQGEIRHSWFFAGQQGRTEVSRVSSARGERFRVQDEISGQEISSRCGQDVNVRLNSRISAGGNSLVNVDRLVLRLYHRRCR